MTILSAWSKHTSTLVYRSKRDKLEKTEEWQNADEAERTRIEDEDRVRAFFF